MDLFNLLTKHTSVRSFENRKISENLKKQLITAAQSGSSSNFVQAYSIIEIQDVDKLAEIEKISKCEGYGVDSGVFYIFVADLNRNYHISQKTNDDLSALSSMESLIVAIVDTVISAQNMVVFAESKKLGACYIGGIRNDIFRMAEILNLPPFTVPLFGLTIGFPKEQNQVKPRLMMEEILHIDNYETLKDSNLNKYDEITRDYYKYRGENSKLTDWSNKIQKHFEINRRPDILEFLKKQKFFVNDNLEND